MIMMLCLRMVNEVFVYLSGRPLETTGAASEYC